MKPLLVGLAIGAFLWVIGTFHPFGLTLPWESGDPSATNRSMLTIMAAHEELMIEELDWGRTTPFNFVASEGLFIGEGQQSEMCSALRRSLALWGNVVDSVRSDNGCFHEARGPGPMVATIELTAEQRRQLRIEVRVQHTR